MSKHPVSLITTEGTFRGLAKQNILFHQCVGELVDNAIAATQPGMKFKIDIIFGPERTPDVIDLYVVDNGQGMSLDILKKALQLGESATTSNRLNEHGFGLKNALATLSGSNGYWKMWTREQGTTTISSVEGPFKPDMNVEDNDKFPQESFLPADYSTLILVPVKKTFVRSVQGRGAPASDLYTLRSWLVEHLGVLYRGYLNQDEDTYENSGTIVVHIDRNSMKVPPITVPFGTSSVERFNVEVGGRVLELEYKYGALDEVRRDRLVGGQKAKFYYQGNIQTQGIDIRLGKRTIATMQLKTIWKNEKGVSQLQPHNNYNDFVGELIIPEIPRGILTTINNKTDFNLDDSDWIKIFEILNTYRPPKQIKSKTEKDLKDSWVKMLRATNKEDEVTDERHVWPSGTRIDVYRKKQDGQIIIYELKAGMGAPIDLYQLRMYWDGLVVCNKEFPQEAILLCEDFDAKLEEMANMMNDLPCPVGSKPYNFNIERLKDKGLI